MLTQEAISRVWQWWQSRQFDRFRQSAQSASGAMVDAAPQMRTAGWTSLILRHDGLSIRLYFRMQLAINTSLCLAV